MQDQSAISTMRAFRRHRWIMGILLLVWIAVIVCLSSVPPVSRDALTHHLRVPQLYIDHGGMVELPAIKFSYYPMNLDMLYLVPLLWGNDIIPKYIHFAFALGTAVLLYCFLAPRLGAAYGWFGVFFFLSLPIIIKLSITVYVDLGLVFFMAAAMLQLLRWAENGCRPRQLVIAGVYCGLALGTKYNALIGFVLLVAAIPYLRHRYASDPNGSDSMTASEPGQLLRFKLSVVDICWFSLAVLVIFSPWMLRNMHWQGNPLYPLFDGWFNAGTQIKAPKFDPMSLRRVIYGESIWEILAVPLRVFFQGEDNNPQLFDGRLSPFLFVLPLLGILRFKNDSRHVRTQKVYFLGFSVLFMIIAFFESHMRIRYIAPIIVPLIVLSAYGLHNLTGLVGRISAIDGRQGSTSYAVWVGVGIGAMVIATNLVYLKTQWDYVDPIAYLSGKLDRTAYITKYRPEYELYRFGNAELAADAKVLALFLGNRGFRFKRDIVFDIPGFQRLLEASEDPHVLGNHLHQLGFSHLMVNHRLFDAWVTSNLTEKQRNCVELFLRTAVRTMLKTKTGHVLYALEPRSVS